MDQHRVLDGSFMAMQQLVGMLRTMMTTTMTTVDDEADRKATTFLCDFVKEVRRPGNLVEQLIDKHGVMGRLSLASQ